MTTFTTEDRLSAERKDKVQELQEEIRSLKIQLKTANDRIESWKKAYDTAMDYAKKTLGGRCD
jgi:predicted RNase H-like nuclease (RuvC/YqgF family)